MATTPSAQFSLTIRLEIVDRPGMLGRVASAIGDAGGTIGAVDLVAIDGGRTVRDITALCAEQATWGAITAALEALDGVRVLDTVDRTFQIHLGGKI
ncbi:MAG TPA: ACT domain-containing protein, partial [Conexibacter sp.]|nr:ACT domain-containing protein [Conexibacter sp.]